MLELGVQTKEAVQDENSAEGFSLLRQAGFSCADFSLNAYLLNSMTIYGIRWRRKAWRSVPFWVTVILLCMVLSWRGNWAARTRNGHRRKSLSIIWRHRRGRWG